MIRYNITYTQLINRIQKEDPGWLDEAEKRTQTFRRLRQYKEERAGRIVSLYIALRALKNAANDEDRELARLSIRHLTSPESPHTNCLRSFKRLYDSDRQRAQVVVEIIKRYLRSGS